jgi:hypothetical protein
MLVADLHHFLDLPGDPMALPELDIARVRRWCAARVPEHALHQVRVECQVAPRHLRNLRFHIYDLLAPSNRVDDLLTELDRDPTHIFWG